MWIKSPEKLRPCASGRKAWERPRLTSGCTATRGTSRPGRVYRRVWGGQRWWNSGQLPGTRHPCRLLPWCCRRVTSDCTPKAGPWMCWPGMSDRQEQKQASWFLSPNPGLGFPCPEVGGFLWGAVHITKNFKANNSAALSTFTVLCKLHDYLVPKHFHPHPKGEPIPLGSYSPFRCLPIPDNHQSAFCLYGFEVGEFPKESFSQFLTVRPRRETRCVRNGSTAWLRT